MGEALRFAHDRLPEQVARAEAMASGCTTVFGRSVSIPILPVAYVPDLQEVHAVARVGESPTPDLMLVSSFHSDDLATLHVKGKRLDERECDALWSDLVKQLTGIARFDWTRGTVEHCRIEINDGDVMARVSPDATELRIVATSGGVHTMRSATGRMPWRSSALPVTMRVAGI